jgi:predicted phosphate transport protein (TIGR00153 family)
MFFPRKTNFSDIFEELVNKIEESGLLFMEMLNNYEQADVFITRLNAIENEADAITHKIYQSLHKTFITPIDREDLYALVNKMDTIVDMIEASAVRMNLYKIEKPIAEIEDLARVMNKAIALVKRLVYDMRRRKANYQIILDNCNLIDELETEGDHLLRRSMQQLFEREQDAIELIKWKDIFERIEDAIDTCRDVSAVIEGMILKYG